MSKHPLSKHSRIDSGNILAFLQDDNIDEFHKACAEHRYRACVSGYFYMLVRGIKEMSRSRITTAPWIYAVLAFSAAFCVFGIALMSEEESGWELWGAVTLLVLFSIALLVASFTKIENNGDYVTIVDNLKRTQIQKISIEKVSWEKGVGSYLRLTNGEIVNLPITGRNEQGVANSVRSWLSQP